MMALALLPEPEMPPASDRIGLIATFRLLSVSRGYAQEKGILTGRAKDTLFIGYINKLLE